MGPMGIRSGPESPTDDCPKPERQFQVDQHSEAADQTSKIQNTQQVAFLALTSPARPGKSWTAAY